MAAFTEAEKKQMWKLFKLTPEQLLETQSVFRCLITDFETRDTAAGDLLIPDIQTELVSIATDQATLITLKAGGPIQEFVADNEGRIEYVEGATSFTTLDSDIKSRIKAIKDQIDPWGFLNPYVQCGKVIPTT